MNGRWSTLAFSGALALYLVSSLASAQMDTLQETQAKTDRLGRDVQARINTLDEQSQKAFWEYRQVSSQLRVQEQYNEQLRKRIKNQNKKISSLESQLQEIEETKKNIVPLMDTMVDALANFVSSDKPFQLESRRQRVNAARQELESADSSTGDRYRQILEAYRKEMEYGRNISAYRDQLELKGATRTVEYLRIGRVALLYQTPDRQMQGFWHPVKNEWVKLSDRYQEPIQRGLRIAKEQTAPEMIRVPVVQVGDKK